MFQLPSLRPPRAAMPALAALLVAATAAACTDSINQRVPVGFEPAEVAPGVSSADWLPTAVEVSVPASLTVSTDPEQRVPGTDIVWWGDPAGPPEVRRAQVAAIMDEAVSEGLAGLAGVTPVSVEVVLRRFHALTPRARKSCSILGCLGNTNIDFEIGIRDAATGAVLVRSGLIEADPPTVQGDAARTADLSGVTDRDRIVAYLARIVARWAGTLP